jgi:acyl-homoserine-lactone acylase
MNSNDSYWLTNASAPLTGFTPFYGDAEEAPSPRTRMNHILLGEADKFTFDSLKKQIMSNRALTSELLLNTVIERCRAGGKKLTKACDALAAWDGSFGVDAKGALLWREMLSSFETKDWADPFDKAEPIATPRGLAAAPAKGKDPLVGEITAAADRLSKADIPLDARLGDLQFTERGDKRFGVPGSNWREGSTNPSVWIDRSSTLLPSRDRGHVINPTTGLTDRGYPVNYGTSFLMAVAFEDDGPRAEALVTYSGSEDPRSPHFSDQTALYSSGTPWRPVLFTPQQIQADPNLREQEVTAPR